MMIPPRLAHLLAPTRGNVCADITGLPLLYGPTEEGQVAITIPVQSLALTLDATESLHVAQKLRATGRIPCGMGTVR